MSTPEAPRDVTTATDPVAAVLEAHRRGYPVALPTSGTSATPRCVVRTTASWVASFPTVTGLLELRTSSRVWVPGPLTATMNLFAAVHAACLGAARVPRPAGATHMVLTPTGLQRLLADVPDLTGVHLLVAGDRLSQALAARAAAAGGRVSHYYGAAELSFVAWGSHEGDLRRFPGVEVAARQGRLWVRSPYLCEGYLGAPGPLVRDGEWATVGDRGTVTEDRVRVFGRGAEAVTTAGATVQVADVESVLRTAGHGEVVVVGVPHGHLGQVLVGVLTDPGDLARVRGRARRRLQPAHRPRRWVHLPELPLTTAGKVDRSRLAAQVAERPVAGPGPGDHLTDPGADTPG